MIDNINKKNSPQLNTHKANLTGFSILEVIIAVAVIAIGMIGVFSLIIQNSKVYFINKNKFTAIMLAQEGIELVRNERDSNWLDDDDWDDNINSGGADGEFAVDVDPNTDTVRVNHAIDSIDNAPLYLDGKRYTHSAGGNTLTRFKRLIEVEPATADCPASYCMKINSKIKWEDKGRDYNFDISVLMYNWRD